MPADAARVGAAPAGPPGTVYHDEDIDREDDVEVEVSGRAGRAASSTTRMTS